jgi:hypothetical protein
VGNVVVDGQGAQRLSGGATANQFSIRDQLPKATTTLHLWILAASAQHTINTPAPTAPKGGNWVGFGLIGRSNMISATETEPNG